MARLDVKKRQGEENEREEQHRQILHSKSHSSGRNASGQVQD
jgi:hypothetical protein